jgi:pimeloyl-ACP methyl ester carboxylesterase
VLLHGAGGGAWEWQLWRGVFEAAGVACHCPELLPDVAGLAATTLADYLGQARTAYQHASVQQQPVVLIGASLGGLLALQLAGERPPAALVLINAMPPAPLHAGLPARDWPAVEPWGRERSLAGTRRALFDADDATCLAAFRQWRDESGRALREAAAGVDLAVPDCPVLVWASEDDEDVPPHTSRELAERLNADFRLLRAASHCGPLLGRQATDCAAQTRAWLVGLPGLRGDSPR